MPFLHPPWRESILLGVFSFPYTRVCVPFRLEHLELVHELIVSFFNHAPAFFSAFSAHVFFYMPTSYVTDLASALPLSPAPPGDASHWLRRAPPSHAASAAGRF